MNSAEQLKDVGPPDATDQRHSQNWFTRRRIVVGSIAIVAAAALLFVGLHMAQLSKGASAMGDWPYYGSPSAAMGAADVVVTVQYIDSRTDTMYPIASDSTDPVLNPQAGIAVTQDTKETALNVVISRVAVLTSIKGELEAGQVIEVSQLGTKFLGISYPAAGITFIGDIAKQDNADAAETSVLLLLSQYPEAPYSPINPEEGALLVVGDQVIPTNPNLVAPTSLSTYLDVQ